MGPIQSWWHPFGWQAWKTFLSFSYSFKFMPGWLSFFIKPHQIAFTEVVYSNNSWRDGHCIKGQERWLIFPCMKWTILQRVFWLMVVIISLRRPSFTLPQRRRNHCFSHCLHPSSVLWRHSVFSSSWIHILRLDVKHLLGQWSGDILISVGFLLKSWSYAGSYGWLIIP